MAVSATAIARIWKGDGFRLFLSHKSKDKKNVGMLKDELRKYGVFSFVAHANIEPMQTWQNEIERALESMGGLVALMTKDFHDSDWTDQEIGFALGRGVPIIAVNLGRNPYGFIGSVQALKTKWDNAAEEIVKLLIRKRQMFDAYVQAVRDCPNFETANKLAKILPARKRLDEEQVQALVDAYNSSSQVYESYGFNGQKPSTYGPGLIGHLDRWAPKQYEIGEGAPYAIRRTARRRKR